MDADTFIELVTYKVNFDKLVSDIQGATKWKTKMKNISRWLGTHY
jgi:hypothetical protein